MRICEKAWSRSRLTTGIIRALLQNAIAALEKYMAHIGIADGVTVEEHTPAYSDIYVSSRSRIHATKSSHMTASTMGPRKSPVMP
jgi:hypothetical protein